MPDYLQPWPRTPRQPLWCQSASPSSQVCHTHLGHALGLVTQVKKEWEQAPLHDLLQLPLVVPQRSLHHFVVEADGELLQLAALLVGRKRGRLQQELLPARGEQGR